MKLTESQKQMLFESAKRMLLEANPNDPNGVSDAEFENSDFDGDPHEDEEFSKNDEFDPREFSKVIRELYLSYKSILAGSYRYIKKMDTLITGYNAGSPLLKFRWDNVYVAMQTALDDAGPNQKSLNKAGANFKHYLTNNLVTIINGTNIPTNKNMYIYFYKYFQNLMTRYYDETSEYFDYLKVIMESKIKHQLKLTKENNNTYHVFSHSSKNYLKTTHDYYYKMNFEASGTNKGFYKHVRDLFMKGKKVEDENHREPNPYDGQKPTNAPRLPHKGSNQEVSAQNDSINRRKYIAAKSDVLNKIHDLTKKFVASNYKDKAIKLELDKLDKELDSIEDIYLKLVNNPDLRYKFDSINDKFNGDGMGAWSEYNPGDGGSQRRSNRVTPKDPKRDNYRSTTKHPREPGFRQGNWDHDLQDYGRDNNRDLNDYGGRDD